MVAPLLHVLLCDYSYFCLGYMICTDHFHLQAGDKQKDVDSDSLQQQLYSVCSTYMTTVTRVLWLEHTNIECSFVSCIASLFSLVSLMIVMTAVKMKEVMIVQRIVHPVVRK